jgi:TPP-dependent pyruvate/acetoin dehydrogenase alpha subunit
MAYNIARSNILKPIINEYMLNPLGIAKARLGSMNLVNTDRNIIYTSSILGNNFSVSAGISMSDKVKKIKSVTFVLGGDGSMEEGSFYESLVMMKSLNLNVILIIENNEWSLGTHITERRTPINIKKLVDAVGIKYVNLKNNNVDSYTNILSDLRANCLKLNEPICIEVNLKTLGDRISPPTFDYPKGKYINYHAGPSFTVDISSNIYGILLKENSYDPIYILKQEIGEKKFNSIAKNIYQKLKLELT